MIYAKTPTSTLTKKQIKKVLQFCAEWCYENMGVNNRKRSGLTYSFGKEEEGFYGFYCPFANHIRLSLTECKTVGRLTSTFIHEYTHYLQPVRTKYIPALITHGYWDNPLGPLHFPGHIAHAVPAHERKDNQNHGRREAGHRVEVRSGSRCHQRPRPNSRPPVIHGNDNQPGTCQAEYSKQFQESSGFLKGTGALNSHVVEDP